MEDPLDASPPEVTVRRAELADVPAMARMFTVDLESRLANLGPGFVDTLHRHVVRTPYCVSRVAESDGVVGFAVAQTSGGPFFRDFLWRRGLTAALQALPHALSLANLRIALTGLAYFGRAPNTDPEAELVSIAVDSRARGQGIAKRLFRSIIAGLADKGVGTFKVCTRSDNQPANRLYEHSGCRLLRQERLYADVEMNVYVWPGA